MSKLDQKKININLGKKEGICVKLSDDVFEGKHPNSILEGYTSMGRITKNPTVGEPFTIIGIGLRNLFCTSVVTEIVSETEEEIKFKTMNSTYILKFLD